jgi:hypothetical protein
MISNSQRPRQNMAAIVIDALPRELRGPFG